MVTLESETFHIDTPDELGEASRKLYGELVELIPARQGKLVKFTTVAQGKRVVNDLVLIAMQNKNSVFEEKIKKSPWRKIYIRPEKEAV